VQQPALEWAQLVDLEWEQLGLAGQEGVHGPKGKAVDLPVMPPVAPLAKLTREVPVGEFLLEPKWDPSCSWIVPIQMIRLTAAWSQTPVFF
jgi:hypothetical protein